ncbi:MAG: hypothetical protein WDN31_18465 [Hyphomicrobium sp.]
MADEEAAKYRQAWSDGDPDASNTFIGEAAGLIHGIEPAGVIIDPHGRRGRKPHRRRRPPHRPLTNRVSCAAHVRAAFCS